MKNFSLLPFLFCCIACGGEKTDPEKGTPVSGPFTLHCDESVYPLMKVLTDGYMNIYPQVVITVDTSQDGNQWALFDGKNIYSLITTTLPSTADSTAMSQRHIYPKIFHFASDAIAFVTMKKDTTDDSWFTMKQESTCLTQSFSEPSARFITDHQGSDNSMLLQHYFHFNNQDCGVEIFAAGKHQQILERVISHSDETGIIGWSYLSEKASPQVKKWRSQLEIIPYRSNDTLRVYPTQSALATGTYPLTRRLYLATAEPYAGPATGFAAFVASAEGQRIIRLFGLAPAKNAPREIVVN